MGFRAATIDPNTGGTATITCAVPTYSAGDALWALYNADEVNTPLTIPSDFTLVDNYQSSSYDNNTSAIFKYTGNGGAGCPASGLPSTYSFTTSSQSYPSTGLLLMTWSGIQPTTITAVQGTVVSSNHATPTTETLTSCTTAIGDQVFVFVAGDATDNDCVFHVSIPGFTVREESNFINQNSEYSPIAVLSADALATGTSTGPLTISITSSPSGRSYGGLMAWIVSVPTVPVTGYRDSTVTGFPSGTGSPVAPMPTVVLGDQVWAWCIQRAGGGWTAPVDGLWTLVDQGVNTTSNNYDTGWALFCLTGGVGASPPTTFTPTINGLESVIILVSVASSSATPTFATLSKNTNDGGTLPHDSPSPISVSAAGGTCTAGDTLLIFTESAGGNDSPWTISAPTCALGTATVRQNAYQADNASANLATLDAVAAGATSSINFTFTATNPTTDGSIVVYVISIPGAASAVATLAWIIAM